MNVIEISGFRFIKAADAARRVGYTADYVGQLARAGKIEAQQIGRSWYVKEDDILAHKKGNLRSNKQKAQEAFHKEVEKESPHAIYNSMYTPGEYVPEYRKRLLNASIAYERDERPLTLSLKREPERMISEAEHSTVETNPEDNLVHTIRIGRDLEIEAQEGASILHAERAPLPPMHGELTLVEEGGGEKNGADPTSSELTFVPAKILGARLPLSLGKRFATALVPIALVLTLAFACSSVFLEKVIVYQQGQGVSSQPSFVTSYGVTNVATVREMLSR